VELEPWNAAARGNLAAAYCGCGRLEEGSGVSCGDGDRSGEPEAAVGARTGVLLARIAPGVASVEALPLPGNSRLDAVVRSFRMCHDLQDDRHPPEDAAVRDLARRRPATGRRSRRFPAVREERGGFPGGDRADGFFIVASGKVKVFKLSGREGADPPRPGGGQTFAEAVIFEGGGYPAHAETLNDAELLFLPKRPFVDLLNGIRKWRSGCWRPSPAGSSG